jgi:hypothetical protein
VLSVPHDYALKLTSAAATARAAGRRLRTHPRVAAVIAGVRAALRTRCDASAERWLLEVLAISYADPDAKTADGKPATRLTFGEKVRALELQGRALGFLKEQLEVRGAVQAARGGRPGEPASAATVGKPRTRPASTHARRAANGTHKTRAKRTALTPAPRPSVPPPASLALEQVEALTREQQRP